MHDGELIAACGPSRIPGQVSPWDPSKPDFDYYLYDSPSTNDANIGYTSQMLDNGDVGWFYRKDIGKFDSLCTVAVEFTGRSGPLKDYSLTGACAPHGHYGRDSD